MKRTVTVINPQGLHLRPAGLFAKLASQFQAKIEVVRGGERVDGKSVTSLMLLAVEQGGQFSIEAAGEDAPQAIESLAKLVEQGFDQ